MMAATKLQTEHAELDAFSRNQNRERDSLSRRLPQRDVEDLQFLWTVLPGRVGLASNMGAQIARMQQSVHRDVALTKAKTKPTTPSDDLNEVAAEAERAWRRSMRSHVELDIPDEPDEVVARYRGARSPEYGPDGVTKYAKGYPHQTIHCASNAVSSGCMRMVACSSDDDRRDSGELVTEPLPLESWVEPKNRPVRTKLRACWRALCRMLDQGDGDLVAALYAVYSGELPAPELREILGDVAALVTYSATVQAHAEKLTRQLRAKLGADRVAARELRRERWQDGGRRQAFDTWVPNPGRHIGRRETVTATEAARALLQPKHDDGADVKAAKLEARYDVKRECEAILVEAGRVYLVAKGAR